IKQLYLFALKNPMLYDQLLPTTIKNPLLQDVLTVLPLRTQSGRRVFVIEVGKWKTKDVSLTELFRCVLLLVEAAIMEYRTQISGVEVIYDLEGLSIQHIYHISPSFASAAVHWAQECVPLRFKGHHIVNQPYIFNMLFALFKPFLSQKFRNRIYFHGRNYNSLLRLIDEKYLPKKYGGKIDSLEFNRMEFYELLLTYQEDFESESSEAVSKMRFIYLCCRDGIFSNGNLPTLHSILPIFHLYLCIIFIQCHTGYWFFIVFWNTCLLTASSARRPNTVTARKSLSGKTVCMQVNQLDSGQKYAMTSRLIFVRYNLHVNSAFIILISAGCPTLHTKNVTMYTCVSKGMFRDLYTPSTEFVKEIYICTYFSVSHSFRRLSRSLQVALLHQPVERPYLTSLPPA
ncbi:hypothetical protein Cfor_04623, partial [Coptotermes formosanus]